MHIIRIVILSKDVKLPSEMKYLCSNVHNEKSDDYSEELYLTNTDGVVRYTVG